MDNLTKPNQPDKQPNRAQITSARIHIHASSDQQQQQHISFRKREIVMREKKTKSKKQNDFGITAPSFPFPGTLPRGEGTALDTTRPSDIQRQAIETDSRAGVKSRCKAWRARRYSAAQQSASTIQTTTMNEVWRAQKNTR
jgi:hypothetical protein